MKIGHIAIYVKDLETSRKFYCCYFNGKSSGTYVNGAKGFSSSFITFEDGCRLELMHQSKRTHSNSNDNLGIHHIAFNVGLKENVDALTEKMRVDGYTVFGEPRTTGDGYYESIVLDPDGNMIEITE